jgi:hypothetical protein
MFRALGCFGLGILFLAISSELRMTVLNILEAISHWIETYSPLSYVGIAVAILAGLMFCLHRAAQPRC